MSKTYLISLLPIGKFFFGGDMTFAAPGVEKEFTSYIIRSNKFPQQSSLLGMLRYLILRNDSDAFNKKTQSICDRGKAKSLIGEHGFHMTGKEENYGVVKRLYPCFIQSQKSDGNWVNLHRVFKGEEWNIDMDNSTSAIINGSSVKIPSMEYDAKKNYIPQYRCSESDTPVLETSIFVEDECNGINRNVDTGKTDDNAFFKQISYRLNEGYRFAFYAEVDLDSLNNYYGVVQVGGDNSQFVVEIEECEIPKNEQVAGRSIILTSPAFLSKDDLAKVIFAVTDIIPFRSMKTKTEDVEAYNKQNKMHKYTEKVFLYSTGSVFYFDTEQDAKDFAGLIKAHADFYQIGYNHYQINK